MMAASLRSSPQILRRFCNPFWGPGAPRVMATGLRTGRRRPRRIRRRGASVAAAFFAAAFLAGAFLAAAFFLAGAFFLAAAFGRLLLGGGLLLGRLLLRRAGVAADLEQLGRPLVGDGLDLVALAQRGVGLAVGDVEAEAAVLEHHGLARHGVDAELAQGCRGGLAPALLGLGQDLERPGQLDGEDLLLVLERAGLGLGGAVLVDEVLLEVRPVAPVHGEDLVAVGRIDTDHPGQRQELQRVVEGDPLDGHGLEQRRRLGLVLGLDLALALGHLADLHVGAEAPGLGDHVEPGLGVLAEHAVAVAGRQQLHGLEHVELVGGEVVGDRRRLLALLQVRARTCPA